MGLFGRQGKPWSDQVTLTRGERVLVARQAPAGWVVATTHALWLPDRAGLTRVGWESVDTASWDRDSSVLAVREVGSTDGRPRRWTLRMDDDRDLLLLVKEQVRATVVTSRHADVAGGGVTVVARRPPGSDGLTWAVSADPGVDVGDVDVRRVIESRLAEMKAELGV